MPSQYDIWFVPSNTSHLTKFKSVMEPLRQLGLGVHVLCVDSTLEPMHHCLDQIERSGFPFEVLPSGGFDPSEHWLRQRLHRDRLEREFDKFLGGLKADALVLGYDSYVNCRAVVRVARKRGIATVLIPDGLVLIPNRKHKGPLAARVATCIQRWLGVASSRGTSGVDAVVAMNEAGKQALVHGGVRQDKVVVVGSTEYDELAKRLAAGATPAPREELRRRLGLPQDRPIVFFAHQTLDGTDEQLFRAMVDGVRRCGAVLLVKLHPRGDQFPQNWRDWAQREHISPQEAVFVREGCTTVEILQASAACVTAFSTVALEAFVCNCPLVLIQYLDVEFSLPYGRQYGAALDANSPGELADAIVTAVSDEPTRRKLARGRQLAIQGELLGLDGQSSRRIVDAIVQTIEQKQRGLARPSGADPS